MTVGTLGKEQRRQILWYQDITCTRKDNYITLGEWVASDKIPSCLFLSLSLSPLSFLAKLLFKMSLSPLTHFWMDTLSFGFGPHFIQVPLRDQ